MAAGSLWLTITGTAPVLVGLLVIVLGIAAASDRALLRGRAAVLAIELCGPEEVLLEFSDGTRHAVRAQRRRYVSRFGVGLRLGGGRRRSLFVAGGMLDPAAARNLRLWALWGRVPAGQGEAFPA